MVEDRAKTTTTLRKSEAKLTQQVKGQLEKLSINGPKVRKIHIFREKSKCN